MCLETGAELESAAWDPVAGDSLPAMEGTPSSEGSVPTLHVRCYPERDSGLETVRGWAAPHREAVQGVSDALATLADAVAARTGFDRVTWRVEARPPVDLPADTGDFGAVADDLYDDLESRGSLTGACCHLILAWQPLNTDLGYGRVPGSYGLVGRRAGDAITFANVGATETYDTRAATVNMAIHEMLHPFLDDDAVGAVIDSDCDHDLGTVEAVADDVRYVSPIATAYAGAGTDDQDLSFAGSGCGDHDRFFHHDGTEDVDEWVHTPELSDGVLEGVARYVAATFDDGD